MRNLMDPDEDRETDDQVPSWVKRTQLGDNYFNLLPVKIDLGSEKQEQKP